MSVQMTSPVGSESLDTGVSSEGSPGEVLGPTVLFWMVCFAINAITQPTGRVLAMPSRHASILRSSPIICACDAIAALVEWCTLVHGPGPSRSRRLSFRAAAFQILQGRIVDGNGAPDIPTIKRIKEQTRLRVVTFLLGTVPQYVKLFASRGVPLSTAFGGMYLGSWLLFETLFWAATIIDSGAATTAISVTAQANQKRRRSRLWSRTALILNALIYFTPTIILVPTIAFQIGAGQPPDEFTNFRLYMILTLLSVFPCGVPQFWTCLWWEAPWDTYRTFQIFATHFAVWWLATVGIVVPPLCLVVAEAVRDRDAGRFVASERRSLARVVSFVAVGGVGSLAAGVALLRGGLGRGRQRELWGMDAFDIMRLASMIHMPVLYYCLLYDPAGTYQPEWLQWLG